MITSEFERILLNNAFRGDSSELPATYYVGLCNNNLVTRDMTMSDIIEVVGDGYERKALPASVTSWGEPQPQSDCTSIRSEQVSYSAASDWTSFNRMFLCDASSGTDCKLLAISTPLANEVSLTTGINYPAAFEFYLK